MNWYRTLVIVFYPIILLAVTISWYKWRERSTWKEMYMYMWMAD